MRRSDTLISELVELLERGMTVAKACDKLNISVSNFYSWKRMYPELVVDRKKIIIRRLIEEIKANPGSTIQTVCDNCGVHPTTFYKRLRKSGSLRQAVALMKEISSKRTGFKSFYAEQLAKNGYSKDRIRAIMSLRVNRYTRKTNE